MTPHSTTPYTDASKKPASILVVEDNIAMRYTLATGLRHSGYVVLEAASADEATVLLASSFHIDLVITDIRMPGNIGGHDLVVYIRKIFPSMPVIVSSGTEAQEEYMTLGVSGFFRKPYDLKVLIAHIAKLLPESMTGTEHERK